MRLCVVKIDNDRLIPASKMDQEDFDRLTNGVTYQVELKQPRNLKFTRKFFAMLRVAFDAWEPEPLPLHLKKYGTPDKDFDRFRKEVLIVCGFRKPIFSIKSQELRFEAESISFGSMDEVRFAEVYDKVATYLLGQFLRNYTRDDLDNVVNELVGFV